MEKVIQHINNNFDTHVNELSQMCKIPSISFANFDKATCVENAKMIAEHFKSSGLENIQVLELEGAHPYVYADYCHQPGKPTVLLYGHYDVQPIGRKDIWESDPFVPVIKDGVGGKRLYGRGTADDKGAIVMHTALIKAYLDTKTELPVNIKILIEGEEEVGSAHFPEFIKKHKDLIKSDVLIVPDSTFADVGVPSLTFSLRGVCILEFSLQGMKAPLHSGLFGGLIPDPAIAMSKICAGLVNDKGQITVPQIKDMVPELTDDEKNIFASLTFDEADYRKKTGLFEETKLLQYSDYPQAQIWRYPHLTVNAIQASSREQAGNIIVQEAWARITVRTPALMSAEAVLSGLIEHVKEKTPWGLKYQTLTQDACDGWQVDMNGKDKNIFDAAQFAFKQGYDKDVVLTGCGASIPLVKTYADEMKAPVLLTPLHDAYGNIHAENESLHLDDWKKGMISQVHFINTLGSN